MRPTSARLLATLVVLVLLAATPGSAQDPGSSRLISLEFRGGTAAEYLTMLRRVAADELNVIFAKEAAEVIVPEIELSHVSAAAAVSLLDGQSHEQPGRRITLHVKMLPQRVADERPTFQVLAQVRSSHRPESAHVWTVRALIDSGFSSDAILSAIELGLATLASATEMDVRYHEDTGLLIATGDEGQLDTIEQVVDQLGESIADRRSAKSALREAEAIAELNDLRNEIAHLIMLNERLQHTINERERELATVRTRLDRLLGETKPRDDSNRPGR